MTVWGYARVSKGRNESDRQIAENLQLQVERLIADGVQQEFIVAEAVSGTKRRPELDLLLTKKMQPGDTLTVTYLSRLARSSRFSEWFLDMIEERGLHLRCINEDVDTTTVGGRLFFRIAAVINQAQVEVIREQSMAGQARARSQGKHIGRPAAMTPDKAAAVELLFEQGVGREAAARMVGVGRTTLYHYLKQKYIQQKQRNGRS